MKARLLKKLRKEAKNRFVVRYCYPRYVIRECYSGKDTRFCEFINDLEETIIRLNKLRRDFILFRISELRIELRSEKINKEIRNL